MPADTEQLALLRAKGSLNAPRREAGEEDDAENEVRPAHRATVDRPAIETDRVGGAKGKFWLVAATFRTVKLWLAMPENKTKERDIDPQCVRCGSKMRLSCTEPGGEGDRHTA